MNRFCVSTDSEDLDIRLIHKFLSTESYWARGVTFEDVSKAISNSLCFGGFIGGKQVAFARVVSDFVTFAYLRDMFVTEEYRGLGYGKALVHAVVIHPKLQRLSSFMLCTDDAHEL